MKGVSELWTQGFLTPRLQTREYPLISGYDHPSPISCYLHMDLEIWGNTWKENIFSSITKQAVPWGALGRDTWSGHSTQTPAVCIWLGFHRHVTEFQGHRGSCLTPDVQNAEAASQSWQRETGSPEVSNPLAVLKSVWMGRQRQDKATPRHDSHLFLWEIKSPNHRMLVLEGTSEIT